MKAWFLRYGKKWFAFSKMDLDGLAVLEKIRKWEDVESEKEEKRQEM